MGPVEAALLAARHARPANPHHHRDLVLLAAGEAGQRHLQEPPDQSVLGAGLDQGLEPGRHPGLGQREEGELGLVLAVLYCTVLYCTVLYCPVLYCTVLYCTVLAAQCSLYRRHPASDSWTTE